MAEQPLRPMDDFDSLQRLRAKLARVWLGARWDGADDTAPEAQYAVMHARLDRLAKHDIDAVTGLSDDRQDMPWGDPQRLAACARFCKSIGQRYRGQSRVAAVDGINEAVPVQAPVAGACSPDDFMTVESGWRALALDCIRAIRAADPSRVFIHPVGLGSDLGNFQAGTAANHTARLL